jgi:hypothetical protein
MSQSSNRPPTFDAQFVLTEGGAYKRLKRDLKVLWFLFGVLLFWATKGRAIRRAYRRALADGRPLVLEQEVLPILQGKRP